MKEPAAQFPNLHPLLYLPSFKTRASMEKTLADVSHSKSHRSLLQFALIVRPFCRLQSGAPGLVRDFKDQHNNRVLGPQTPVQAG